MGPRLGVGDHMRRRACRRIVLLAVLAAAVPVAVSSMPAASAATPAVWSPEQVPPIFGRSYVNAMASTSSADVYAAGLTRVFLPGAIETRTMIMHFDGSSWTRMVTPDRETAPAGDQLNGITANGPNDAWAVGWSRRPFSGQFATLVLHYDGNGSTWSIVPSIDTGIFDAFYAASA